eukprot:scaffold26_cov81-Skeletonema_dohrnii-CCMP3373.AAC.1
MEEVGVLPSELLVQQFSNECRPVVLAVWHQFHCSVPNRICSLETELLLPNLLPLQPIHRSSSSPKIQRRLPGKGAAVALIMIGLAFIGEATPNGGGSSNKEISLGTTREYILHLYIPPTCYKEMRYRAAEPMGDCGVMFPAFNR